MTNELPDELWVRPVDLAELERRVTTRYLELTQTDWELPEIDFDMSDWVDVMKLPPGTPPQFPREQWITYPNRRRVVLMIIERSLDIWDTLTDEQRFQVAFLLGNGGRERIA
jgi:hypothetical protein